MNEKSIYEEELESKFRFYDKLKTGFVQQTDLKNVLAEVGISLTLSELVKVVRVFPINEKNHVNYESLIEKLSLTSAEASNQISYE